MSAILLPRPAGDDDDAPLLSALGHEVVRDPYVEVLEPDDVATERTRIRLREALERPGALLVATSSRAVRSLYRGLPAPSAAHVAAPVAAIGAATAATCAALGFRDVRVPSTGSSNADLLDLLAPMEPTTAVVPRSSAAPVTLTDALRGAGWDVVEGTTYVVRTVERTPSTADRLSAGGFAVVVVRSGSAARALAAFVPTWPSATAAVAAGHPTAAVLREVGIPVAAVAERPDAASVVAAVQGVLGS